MDEQSHLLKLFKFFHSLLKFTGFIIIKFDNSNIWWCINVLCVLLNISVALGCTIRSEMWCFEMFDSFFSLKKLILFIILQIITFTPMTMLLFYMTINKKLLRIISQTLRLEEQLRGGRIILNIVGIKAFGTLIFVVMLLTPALLTYLSIALTLPFSLIIDSVCMPYFEFWTVVPYAQFLNWILFLNYIIQRARNEITMFGYPNHYDIFVPICLKLKFPQQRGNGNCSSCKLIKCKCKFIINMIKEILSIAKELSAAYGITICIFLLQYLSRAITQFYDLIDKDAQRFNAWTNAWNVMIRVISILPVFICCELLKYNINKTVQLIQRIVTLHQPSCLDSIFQSLTLRLQHESTTIQLCGFLDITYTSFLGILGTTIAFLVFQLQFLS